ncbi:MAG: hypothetical protein QME78_17070, partial [Thermodesulfobacteriota bacterium]|nr:hypothetical protein [Thermodesulfobacteriota bacterium]
NHGFKNSVISVSSVANLIRSLDCRLIGNGTTNKRQKIIFKELTCDGLVKSPTMRLSVIPAKAGIQSFQIVISSLDSGFHRSDDFLRIHQPVMDPNFYIPFGPKDLFFT